MVAIDEMCMNSLLRPRTDVCAFFTFSPSTSLPSFTSHAHVFCGGLGLRSQIVSCSMPKFMETIFIISILCDSTKAVAYRVLTYDWGRCLCCWLCHLLEFCVFFFVVVYVVGFIVEKKINVLAPRKQIYLIIIETNEAIMRTFVIVEMAWNKEWMTCSSREFICVNAPCPVTEHSAQPAQPNQHEHYDFR